MMKLHRKGRKGFTLVELAIVLAIAGVLFTGLWRLLSGGNQQLKDSASASQQTQLISAVKSFLASPSGQTFMGSQCNGTLPPGSPGCAAGAVKFALPLPAAATPAGSGAGCTTAAIPSAASAADWCSILPSGFSTATTNSYGQTYNIQVIFNSATSANLTAPTTYSFMIVTVGGETASDTSGGRISSQIGGDGGFLYSAPPCAVGGTVLPACGAYGAWAVDPVVTYGYTAGTPAAGHVASRSYISPEQNSNLPWLARLNIPGDATFAYNTLTNGTNLYLNATGFGTTAAPNTIFGTGTAGGVYGGIMDRMNEIFVGMNSTTENPALTVTGPADPLSATPTTPCLATQATTAGTVTTFTDSSGNACPNALQLNGNMAATGMVEANILWASSFLYGTATSDIRMKKDIAPLANALDNIMRLKPVTFRFKQNNKEDIGFIAQDLQKVYPQIVEGRPDGVLGVNYMGLLAPLVSSVQELKKENDQLREQLHAQQDEIRDLQKKAKGSE